MSAKFNTHAAISAGFLLFISLVHSCAANTSSRLAGKPSENSAEANEETIATHTDDQDGVAPRSITGMNMTVMMACQSAEASDVVQLDCGLINKETKTAVLHSSGFKATFLNHVNIAAQQIASAPASTGENKVRYTLAASALRNFLGSIKGQLTLTASANVIDPDGTSTLLSASSAVSLQYGLLFLTKARFTGNMGGWEGAQQACAAEAVNDVAIPAAVKVRYVPLLGGGVDAQTVGAAGVLPGSGGMHRGGARIFG